MRIGKFITAGLVISLILCLNTPVRASSSSFCPFKDIKGHWAKRYIEMVWAKGWFQGWLWTGEKFHPDKAISKGEFCIVLAGAKGLRNKALSIRSLEPTFTDTKYKHYSFGYVEVMDGIINPGYTGIRFHPNQPIPRGVFAAYVTRIMGKESEAITRRWEVAKYSDVSRIPAEWVGHIGIAQQYGWISGKLFNRYYPYRATTRADAAAFVSRCFIMWNDGWDGTSLNKTIESFTKTHPASSFSLTLADSAGSKTAYTVANNCVVYHDGIQKSLQEVIPGRHARILLGPAGTVTFIDTY